MNTVDECMQAAWAAILRGDYAERDRLCERGRMLAEAEHYAEAVTRILAVDFYVNGSGVAIPARELARAARAVQ